MTSKDDDLVMKMLDAWWNATDSYTWEQQMLAVLAIARPIIERKALEKAADLSFVFDLQGPGVGPFTRENRVIEQYRAAIRALVPRDEEESHDADRP